MKLRYTPPLSPYRKFMLGFLFVFGMGILMFGVTHLYIQHSQTVQVHVEAKSEKVYPDLDISRINKKANHYTISINQPVVTDEAINQVIQEWIETKENNFLNQVDEIHETLVAQDDEHLYPHFSIRTQIKQLNEDLYSLELRSDQNFHQANTETDYLTLIIDLNTKEILSAADIFDLSADSKHLPAFYELVHESIQVNTPGHLFAMDTKLEEILTQPETWRLHTDLTQIYFYFAPDELDIDQAEPIKMAVDMADFIYYLNPVFAGKLGWEIPKKIVPLDPAGKYVALTFDDGPHESVTPRVLDILAQHDALATFYMLGSQVEHYPDLAKQVAEAGHELGDHTMQHKYLPKLSRDQIDAELQKSIDHIQQATGQLPQTMRPPYGAIDADVEAVVTVKDLPIVLWSVDSLDWKSRNVDAIHRMVMSTVHPGAIILLHDIHETTADALPYLLTSLEQAGYEMVTVSQLLELGEVEGIGPHRAIDY